MEQQQNDGDTAAKASGPGQCSNPTAEPVGISANVPIATGHDPDIDPGLLIAAIAEWGERSQIEMIQEEAMELALALQQSRRKSKDKNLMMERVIDELADMRIMLAQADIIFDPHAIRARVRFKMDRLAQRLDQTYKP